MSDNTYYTYSRNRGSLFNKYYSNHNLSSPPIPTFRFLSREWKLKQTICIFPMHVFSATKTIKLIQIHKNIEHWRYRDTTFWYITNMPWKTNLGISLVFNFMQHWSYDDRPHWLGAGYGLWFSLPSVVSRSVFHSHRVTLVHPPENVPHINYKLASVLFTNNKYSLVQMAETQN